MASPLNCLICSNIVIRDDDEENCRKMSQFRLGLQLFCKLLKVNVNCVNQLFLCGEREQGGNYLFTGPPPCCKECCRAFEQMLQLQQTIELLQTNLMEQLDKLKAALQTSNPSDLEEKDPFRIPPDDLFGKIRDQLMSYVRNFNIQSSLTSDHKANIKIRKPPTKSSQQPNSKKAKEYQSCSVVLERLPVNLLNSRLRLSTDNDSKTGIILKQDITSSDDHPTVSSSDLNYESGPNIRKSKLKAFEFVRKHSTPQKVTTPPPFPIIKDNCSDINNGDDDNYDAYEYPWEPEAKPISEQLPNQIGSNCEATNLMATGVKVKLKTEFQEKSTKLKKHSGPKLEEDGRLKVRGHFSQVLENSRESLLLFRYTLLKASYGISLSCQESHCNHITNGTDFTAFEHFKNHVKSCHPHSTPNSDATWTCPLCSQEHKTCFGFRRHLLFNCSSASYTTNNSFPFICTVCWRPMNSLSTLEYHQWLHKSETEKDSVLKNTEQPLPTLVKIKEKERQSGLKCGHCQREFKLAVSLKAHQATHVPKEQRKKYKCEQCPKLFLSPVAVRGHVEREHQTELMRKRSCPICGKEYNWRSGHRFRTHLRSHRNEREFVCDICGKAFLNGEALRSHKFKVHEQRDRPWQCEFCEMNYKQSAHLRRHRRNVHKDKVGEEGMKRGEEVKLFIGPRIEFPCPFCDKAFPLKSRMKKHWEKCCKNKKL